MISVIVPVFRVEQYLPKCLDSVCNQTFRDLDIILIDDGSPDRSGEICDAYAVRDPRIRVFHTENRSLSCARNLGIEKALAIGSEYLVFVDSDDWLELEMIEKLHNLAVRTSAEVTACGAVLEYANQSVPVPFKTCEYRAEGDCNAEALIALMNGGIREEVWNKLWRTECFQTIRFPAKWKYQDIGTIFLVIEQTKLVACTKWCGYHYNIYRGSSCRSYVPKDLTYEWFAHHRRYSHFKDVTSKHVSEDKKKAILGLELQKVAIAISRYWAWEITFSKDEKQEYACYIEEMCSFSKEHISLFGERSWPTKLRFMAFLTHYNTTPAFAAAFILNSIRRKLLTRKPG